MDYKIRKLKTVGIRQGAPGVMNMGAWPLAVRKTVIAFAGFGVLMVGVAFIFLPTPGLVVIPLGIAILAREFAWARRLLAWSRDRARRSRASIRVALARVGRFLTPVPCP